MFKKTSSYFIVLLSLSIIFLSFKYDFKNLFPNQLNKKLYLKSQHTNKDVKISIKNGCGIKGLGLTYKKYLLNIGYDVSDFGDAKKPNNENHYGHSDTKIYFHKNNKSSALELSKHLGISSDKIHEKSNSKYYHDLTLILGQDYRNLKSYAEAAKFDYFK